jgi:hypothetical protein
MNKENKSRWWMIAIVSFLVAFVFSLTVANSSWAQSTFVALLALVPPKGPLAVLERVQNQSGDAWLAGLLAVWITSPFALVAGYVFMSKILGDHIKRITPSNPRTVAIRSLGALLVFAMGAYSVLALPGADSVYCRGCEKNSLVFFVFIGCAQICCLGAIIGYAFCILSLSSRE